MLALTIANFKMMVRNRQTTFWALFFPLILVAAFGLFDFTAVGASTVALVGHADSPVARQVSQQIGEVEVLALQESPASKDEGTRLVTEGALDFLIVLPETLVAGLEGTPGEAPPMKGDAAVEPVTLLSGGVGEERVRLVEGIVSEIADAAILGAPAAEKPTTLVSRRLPTREAPYFDVVLMGLVGFGIMAHSIISIAVRISNYRNLSILKRMLVTPLSIWKFFAAEVAAQLGLAVFQAVIILAVGVLVFGARLDGNVLNLLPVIILGSLVFLNLGFIVSAWANSPAAASGLGNVISFPMMFFAGTFFSTSTLPWLLPYAAEALPLAPMINALRDIGLHGATLTDVWPELAWLGGWVAATSAVAVKVFRFS